MKNIFFVPFSGRFDSLSAALSSLIPTLNLSDTFLVIIDVSSPNFLHRVRSLASSLFDSYSSVSFVLCNRDDSLSIVQSWFHSIFRYSSEGDLVHFLGDDDLLIPRTFATRSQILSNSDYAIYTCLSRIFFFCDAQFIADFANVHTYLKGNAPALSFQTWNPYADNLYQSFISICSFKVSSAIRHHIYSLLQVLSKQYWLEPSFAHGMFFYLFPFYLHFNTSLILSQSSLRVSIRGARIQDMYLNDYSDGASRGLYLSSSLHVISSLLSLPPDVITAQSKILSKYILAAHIESLCHSTHSSYLETISRTSLSSTLQPLSRNRLYCLFYRFLTSNSVARLRRLFFIVSLCLRRVKIYGLQQYLEVLRQLV